MVQGLMLAAIFAVFYFVFTNKSEGARRLRVVLGVVAAAFIAMTAYYSPADAPYILVAVAAFGAATWVFKGFAKKG